MYLYNYRSCGNPFGFSDIRNGLSDLRNIRQSTVSGSTSSRRAKKCSKRKLLTKNVKFLKSLGFKVKKQ